MAKFENKMGVNSIEMRKLAHCYCPIGKDWYSVMLTINVDLGGMVPDYIEVDQFFKENIEGKELLIEEAVAKVHDHIVEDIQPLAVMVQAQVQDAAHLPVVVRKHSSMML